MGKTEKIISEFERFVQEYERDIGRTSYDSEVLEGALALLKAQEPITGETSDGYHTFNELYHHRAVLFSVIVANYKDRAWKSVRHHDGTMYYGMFIVGIDTPDGQATYHYDIDPYWDMFDCKVREFAPEWDGHTPAQAIERIGKLKAQEPRVMTDAELIEEIQKAPLVLKPNVDAVPVVHARWRELKDGSEECTNCFGLCPHEENYNGDIIFNFGCEYCPWCGAKMDK